MRGNNNLIFFLVFFGITLFIIVFGQLGIFNWSKEIFTNIPWKATKVFNISGNQVGEVAKLRNENQILRKKVLEKQNLIAENKALRDQFSTSSIPSTNLIPAKVVGSPGFIPGITNPDYIILDKGEKDGLEINDSVVYQNNFVGKIIALSGNFSKVELAISIDSFTAKVVDGKEISGVVRGKGNIIIFDNVLLSESLKKDQIVLTKGDIDENGTGIPPDMVVGKIISIEKKSSNLFQRAEVETFLNFQSLSTVFVIK